MLPIIFLIIFILILVFVFFPRLLVISRWHHLFDKFQFSVQDFYNEVERGIKERELPGVYIFRTEHPEQSVLLAQREYLRVRYEHLIFEICASPYGKGSFVSWWLYRSVSYFEAKAAQSNSTSAAIYESLATKTMYQMDKATMFKESVHLAVTKAIEVMSTAKGYRTLSEIEMIPKDSV